MLVQSISATFCFYIDIRSLIYIANQYAGFYIMTKMNWNELNNLLNFCCTWTQKEKQQDNVSVKICYHHSFSILLFHTFTADPSTFPSMCHADTTIIKPFIRASSVLTGNHITEANAFTRTTIFCHCHLCNPIFWWLFREEEFYGIISQICLTYFQLHCSLKLKLRYFHWVFLLTIYQKWHYSRSCILSSFQ